MAISNEQLFSFIKRNPIGFTCGVISVLLVATNYLRLDKIEAANIDLDEKTRLSDRYLLNKQNANQLNEQYQEITAAQEQIRSRLISTQLGVNQPFFFRIEEATGAKIVSAINQSLPPATEGIGFVPVNITFTIQGSFRQVLDFLNRVENGQPFCRVLTGRVESSGAESGDLLTVNLTVQLLGQQS